MLPKDITPTGEPESYICTICGRQIPNDPAYIHGHAPSEANYVDSRTPEERERDSKVKVTMTSTDYPGEWRTIIPSEDKEIEDWEKQLDDLWQWAGCSECGGIDVDMDKVEALFHQTLHKELEKQKEEITNKYENCPQCTGLREEFRKETVEMIRGMEKEINTCALNYPHDKCGCENPIDEAYNQAIDDILQALTKEEI